MLLIAMDGLEETKELMKEIQSKVKSSWRQTEYKYPSEKWFKECKQSFAKLRDSETCTQESFFTIVRDQMEVNVRTMSLEAAFFALDIGYPPIAPVVMFCGHANMNGYPEVTLDHLAALAINCEAIMVGFLGCCVGRVREGDLLRITHTNGWTAIAGASDRMVTKDDIINTLFLNGAAYLCTMLGQTVPSTDNILDKRCLARFALCMAYTCNEQSPPNDPFIFFNDSDDEYTMNSWLQLAHQSQGCPTGTRDDLLRIAMYHTWTYGGRRDLVDSVQNKLIQHTCLDETEFAKMKDYLMLDTLEKLHQELQKIEVTNSTLKTLAEGKWVEVANKNPVQLAVALYRGVRGSLENGDVISLMIYCFAYIKTSQDFYMIATALVATCETAYFVSDGKNNSVHVEMNVRLNQNIIKLKVDILYSMPISDASPFTKEITSLDDNKKVYLTCSQKWELKDFVVENSDSIELGKLFVFEVRHAESAKRGDFIKLVEGKNGSIELGSMHSIITKLGISIQKPSTCPYTYEDFMAALEQLSHHMKRDSPRNEGWGVTEFSIIPPQDSDRVQVLPSRSIKGSDLYGREVRLMNSSNDNKGLERCRFVYLYNEKNNRYHGNLYYTDVHYWWDLCILLDDSISATKITLEELVKKASDIYNDHRDKQHLAKKILKHTNFFYPLDFIGILSFPVDCSDVNNIHLKTLYYPASAPIGSST